MCFLAVIVLIVCYGCGGQQARSVERLAILPLENLSSDASLDWISRMAAGIVVEELTGSPSTNPRSVETRRDAVAFRATQVLQGYFTEADGRIEIRAFLEDSGKVKILKPLSAEGQLSDGIIPLAEALAHQLIENPQPFATSSSEAIRAYGEALFPTAGSDPRESLEQALAFDPDFGLAYVTLAQLALAEGDTQGARDRVESALKLDGRIDEISRARLNVILESIGGDTLLLAEALENLAGLTPADSDLAERTGQAIMRNHRYGDAAVWLRKAAMMDASRPDIWNSLAYAQAYDRDLEGALESLQRYRDSNPENPNTLDSLGEVYFHLGHFQEAKRYFEETYEMAPAFRGGNMLVKAARAALMSGDLSGAEDLFRHYMELREADNDPFVDYLRARWRYMIGQREQAMAEMAEFSSGQETHPDIASMARAQLSVWALETGQVALAQEYAGKAMNGVSNPVSEAQAALCQFVTQLPVPASEWEQRAQEAYPHESQAEIRKQALAYALLYSKHFSEAGILIREIWEKAAPFTRDEVQVLLAWTLIENGEMDQARELLAVYPLVQPGGESLFCSLVFPRAFYLRAVLATESGDEQAAAGHLRLFKLYSGDIPTIFDKN